MFVTIHSFSDLVKESGTTQIHPVQPSNLCPWAHRMGRAERSKSAVAAVAMQFGVEWRAAWRAVVWFGRGKEPNVALFTLLSGAY